MSIGILQHQADFIESNVRHTGLVGGFGSGKTKGGIWKTIVKKLAMPNVDVAYYMPTYPLIKGVAFPNFSEALTEHNIPFKIHETDKNIATPYGNIILRSMDNPELIVGYEVGYSLVDEADLLPMAKMKKAMIKILARNRSFFEGNNNATDFVSTPEGFKFLYDFFIKNSSENKYLIKASTRSNPFLPDGYIDSLKDEYNLQQLEAYLEGEFVNLTSGNVYTDYDRDKNHSDREFEEGDILYLGMDFNVTKMCAIVHVIDKNIITAVDEIVNEYDTRSLTEVIKNRYKGYRIVVHPDASGKNKKSSATDTDIDILKKAGFQVKALKSNPLVKDRVNTMNKKFRDLTYKVNKHKCPTYTDSLEQQPYRNGEPDKTLGLDHTPDAGGYCIWYNYGKKKNIIYL